MNETHRTVKRLLSAFLCIVMILALAPVSVFAAEGDPAEPTQPVETPQLRTGPVKVYVDRVTTDGKYDQKTITTANTYTEGDTLDMTGSLPTDVTTLDGYIWSKEQSTLTSKIAWSEEGNTLEASVTLIFTPENPAPIETTPATVTISYVYEPVAGHTLTGWTETVEYNSSYTVSSRHENLADYKFNGWMLDGNPAPTEFVATGDVTLKGSYTKNANCGKYYVEYYFENPNKPGEYTLDRTELVTGVAEGEVKVRAKNINGFTLSRGIPAEANINVDNSKPMQLYYDRNSYTITYKVDGKEIGKDTYKFGQAVTLRDAPDAAKGYTFVGWDSDHALGGGSTMPACNVVMSGKMVSGKGAAYTVNVYRQNLKGEYELYHSMKRTGVVGSLTAVTAADVDGYAIKPFSNEKIKADGSTVVSVYYEMTDALKATLTTMNKTVDAMTANGLDAQDKTDAKDETVQPSAKPADDQNAEGADEQDTAAIGEEETPLASGGSGFNFSIIPFIVLGVCLVLAAVVFYIRNKKQEENA